MDSAPRHPERRHKLNGPTARRSGGYDRDGRLVKAIRLSHATMRDVKQDLFFAFVYNALGVPIATGVLYPAFGLRRVRL